MIVENNPRCTENITCKYQKIDEGKITTCVIGAFIPEDKYTPSLEGKSIGTHFSEHNSIICDLFSQVDPFLVLAIQRTHDHVDSPITRVLQMIEIAEKYKLIRPKVDL